ncbi:MAG: ATP-binding cassette domain-containing protein [Lachnospiraceae bacterium]|nr:ATP-binding cassette domain-containing protein [Lachnospiraceae bacterium]
MAIIKIDHLKYRYPKTEKLALNDVSIEIEKGEFIGIAGRNGAGKSTLGQAVNGLVPRFYNGAYGGRVEVKGVTVEETPVEEMCENVGLIFQNPFNQLSGAAETVFNEVAYGLQNLGTDPAVIKEKVREVLKRLEIWEYRDRNPFELSGGQMQRVAIASILCMEPDIIILDEPTSQLDPQGTEEVFRVVDDLTDTGITIIMIEQKLEKLARYCDRIILMHEGRVVDIDTPEKIFSRDDLETYGVQPPAYVRISREYGLSLPDGTCPVTLEDTEKLFREKGVQPEMQTKPANISEKSEDIFRMEDVDFYYTEGTDIFKKLVLGLDNRPTAIIGQNGAGKTTLVRLLKGLLKPIGGRILFRNEDISGKTVAMLADKVGYVFQNPDDQIFKYRVLDETMFGPLNIGMSEDKAKEESLKALELMGLKGREDVNPYDLELHERKMTAIASVVAMDTDVIILDEPTIAQDYEGRRLIGEMIKELSSRGKLVIAILHDMDFVEEYFERVIVMAHGRILSEGSAEKVFSEDEVLKEARLQKPYLISLREKLSS